MASASAAADDVDEEKSIVTGTWHERVVARLSSHDLAMVWSTC